MVCLVGATSLTVVRSFCEFIETLFVLRSAKILVSVDPNEICSLLRLIVGSLLLAERVGG